MHVFLQYKFISCIRNLNIMKTNTFQFFLIKLLHFIFTMNQKRFLNFRNVLTTQKCFHFIIITMTGESLYLHYFRINFVYFT